MIDVKDEKLSGEPKYQIRDGQGNIVVDNATIEMITPVVQEPTPLNKALFDSIKKDLELKENLSNKTQKINSSSKIEQYPSAKAVYDAIISNINAIPKFIKVLNFNQDSEESSINISDFIKESTYKIELILNIPSGYDTDETIAYFNYDEEKHLYRYIALGILTIYPKQGLLLEKINTYVSYHIDGPLGGTTGWKSDTVDELYTNCNFTNASFKWYSEDIKKEYSISMLVYDL